MRSSPANTEHLPSGCSPPRPAGISSDCGSDARPSPASRACHSSTVRPAARLPARPIGCVSPAELDRSRLVAVALDESEHLSPRVLGCCGELLLLAVEEAVGRAVVADDLMHDTRSGERLLECGVVLGGDVLICPG